MPASAAYQPRQQPRLEKWEVEELGSMASISYGLHSMKLFLALVPSCIVLLAAIWEVHTGEGAYPVGRGCNGRQSGDTWNCDCKTGGDDVYDNSTLVFNQCRYAKGRGALYGKDNVGLNGRMGMAVYSGKSRGICGGYNRRCKCTCFDEDAVSGVSEPRFRTNESFQERSDLRQPGYYTDCLGLCGANCLAGVDGPRFASILIHDICQSFIRSTEPMPNANDCSDEGYRAAEAALLTVIAGYSCPP